MIQKTSAQSPFRKAARSRRRRLLKGGVILSMDPKIGNLEQGDVLVEDGIIAAVGASLTANGAEILDMRGMIVLPGFVDCHRHAWEAQMRGLNPNSGTLHDYCCATHFSFAPHYRPEDLYVGTMFTAVGAIEAGVTTIIDNCHNARTDHHAEAAARAWLDSGMRAIFAPGPPLTGAWDESGWPRRRLERLQAMLAGQDRVALAVMAQFRTDVWAIAREMNLPIVSEVPAPELAELVRALAANNLLGPDNIFNHVSGFPPDVLALLKKAGVKVNVCPRSDAQYGMGDGSLGIFQAAREAGLDPAFSIDNETSYSGDMFGEMRAEFFLQRAVTQKQRVEGKPDLPTPITAAHVLEAATIHGARCAGLDRRIGSLTPGKAADLIAIQTDDLNLFPLNNAIGAVVHGAERANIDLVMIGGDVRKQNGAIVGLDEALLRRQVVDSRARLFDAHRFKPNLFCDYHTELADQNPTFNAYWT